MRTIIILSNIVFLFNQGFAQYPTKLDTIVQTTVEPYNNICFLHIYRKRFPKKDKWFKSTGFLIKPNVILTAAHNIHSMNGTKVAAIKVIPGKYYEQSPYGSIEITGMEDCIQAIRTHPSYTFLSKFDTRIKFDFGIIVLPHPVLPEISNAFRIDTTYALQAGDILNVAGYPADNAYKFNGDYITFQQDNCDSVGNKRFAHDLNTYRGNSGSPIWVNKNNERIVIGVHTFGGSGTLLDKDNQKLFYNWLSEIEGNR